MVEFLKAAVNGAANLIVSGGTGSGKTTMLNLLSAFVPNDERIITIEDSAELQLQQEHVIRLETRPPNVEGKGAVTMRDLLKNTLRMRPDRIIVGECRGGESLDMLQAMNTGHDGSLTTLHANSPRDAISRMGVMVAMAGMDLPEKAIRQQIASAVHIIVQVSRLMDGSRRTTHITEITGMEGETVTMQDIYVFEGSSDKPGGKIEGGHRATGIRPKMADKLIAHGQTLPNFGIEMEEEEQMPQKEAKNTGWGD
jgi:pilus assembly protein CpaF